MLEERRRGEKSLSLADGLLPAHKRFTIAFADLDGAATGSRMTFMLKPFLSGAQAEGGNQNGAIKIDSANNLYIIKSSRTNQSCGSILGCCKCLAFCKAFPKHIKSIFHFISAFICAHKISSTGRSLKDRLVRLLGRGEATLEINKPTFHIFQLVWIHVVSRCFLLALPADMRT